MGGVNSQHHSFVLEKQIEQQEDTNEISNDDDGGGDGMKEKPSSNKKKKMIIRSRVKCGGSVRQCVVLQQHTHTNTHSSVVREPGHET